MRFKRLSNDSLFFCMKLVHASYIEIGGCGHVREIDYSDVSNVASKGF